MSPVFSHHEVHLRDYLYVLHKRRHAILIFFLAVVLSGMAFTYFERVIYRAASTVLIERENPNVVDFKEVMAFDTSSTDFYQTQYQIFESRSLIQKLIEAENLAEDAYVRGFQKGGWRALVRNKPWVPGWFEEFAREPMLADVVIRRMLRIDPMRNSRLVKVSILHPDPKRSAELTNRLVEIFIQRNLEDRFLISKQATQLISGQLVELKERVAAAERNLQDYKEKNDLTNISSIREKDAFIQDAKLELVKIQSEESKLAKRYLPAHPKRIHIRSQIEGLQEKIQEEQKRTLESGRAAIEYSELEREAETSRKIYEALLARLGETQSEAQTQASNVMVVDRAEPPSRPYKPRPFLNFAVALFFGLGGGILLGFFLEYLDPTIKIPEDIEKALGLDLLGIIPVAEKNSNGRIFPIQKSASPIAESFRALRTALLFKLRHVEGCRLILVTSPNPEEGKSTICLNLAATFCQNYLRVLLIDADLRKSTLHKSLGVEAEKGLKEVLEDKMPPVEAIHKNVKELGFDFLSRGEASHHPTEILGSQAMRQLLDSLRASYDVILIDSPPYLAVADVAVLSDFADALMVVARYHKTHKRHLRDVTRRFSENGQKVLGAVMNLVSVRERDYYFHQYYYYGYGDAPKKK